MLTTEEQSIIRRTLEQFSNAQLLQLWDLCGIHPASEDERSSLLEGNRELLIRPLFAGIDLATLTNTIIHLSSR